MAAGAVGPRPKRRNAIMVLLLPLALIMGGYVLMFILAMIEPMLGSVAGLVVLVGAVLLFVWMIKMLLELKAFTQDDGFMWWLIFLPCVNYYLMWILTPQQVTKAKQMAGLNQPARGFIVYFLLFPYALAADLNDLAGPG